MNNGVASLQHVCERTSPTSRASKNHTKAVVQAGNASEDHFTNALQSPSAASLHVGRRRRCSSAATRIFRSMKPRGPSKTGGRAECVVARRSGLRGIGNEGPLPCKETNSSASSNLWQSPDPEVSRDELAGNLLRFWGCCVVVSLSDLQC